MTLFSSSRAQERDSQGRIVLRLTNQEYAVLSEAIRYSQQACVEGVDRMDPALSRIQRKLGQEPNA